MKLILLFTSLITANTLMAGITDTLEINAKLSKAIVYYEGATLNRTIEISKSGNYVLAIQDLPDHFYQPSLVLEASSNVDILSVKTKALQLNKATSLTKSELEKRMTMIQDSIHRILTLMEVLDGEFKMIKANQDFSQDDKISTIAEVKLASDFYQSRVKKLMLERLALARSLSKYEEEKSHTQGEINKVQSNEVEISNIVYVHIDASSSNGQIELSYYSPQASWTPFYDVKASNDIDGISLHHKGFVSQQTGEDWDEIELSLSTHKPSFSNRIPILNPLRVQYQSYNQGYNYTTQVNTNGKTGRILDQRGEPMIGANVLLVGTGQGTITDIDGQFYFPQGIGNQVSISYTGYQSQVVQLSDQYTTIFLHESALLDEVVVTGYGGNSRQKAKKEAPVRRNIQLDIKESLNTISYNLTDKYSISSDADPLDVLLRINTIPCALTYESVPTINESAFLVAEIKDWHIYNIEQANANLFIDGIYKGQTQLLPKSQENTLQISLGSDPEINVSRKWVNNKYSKKFLSRHVEEIHHFKIKIKNNKRRMATINLKDQIPISSDDAIEIDTKELSSGQLKEESGELTWKLELKPGESKELDLIYKLKYPKHYTLSL